MRKNITLFIAGLLTGILLTSLFIIIRGSGGLGDSRVSAESNQAQKESSATAEAAEPTESHVSPSPTVAQEPEIHLTQWSDWSEAAAYSGGERVLYQNRIYRAKWWTQNEIPGSSDVWEDTLEAPAISSNGAEASAGSTPPPTGAANKDDKPSFKVVAYYPSWNGEQFNKLQYDVLTHIIYAFAIPNTDGSLKPLDNPALARKLIQNSHRQNVKVLLAVGGWSYNDVPLESTFMEAAADSDKIRKFGDAILDMCNAYGFDGIDMDWEHPRIDGDSSLRYEELMLYLAERLHTEGKLLTSAVISGATADGNIYYDAAAHTDQVLNAVDWIHVMAYDGGDGERHSSYEFAVNCGSYWKDTRQMPASKIILGVPFYSRPGWASYSDILAADSKAWNTDISLFNGMEVCYNGIPTIQDKTRYAAGNLGGIMIWEITQDTSQKEKSLLRAIGDTIQQSFSQ